jgi:hypothetical protein
MNSASELPVYLFIYVGEGSEEQEALIDSSIIFPTGMSIQAPAIR